MSQTSAHLVDHVIPRVPVRHWVLSLPMPLRVLLAAQPERVTAVLQVVQRVVTRHLPDAAGLKAAEGHGDAVTLIPSLRIRRQPQHPPALFGAGDLPPVGVPVSG